METVNMDSDVQFQQVPAENHTSMENMKSSTSEATNRTIFILDIVMIVLSLLLIVFAINSFFVGTVRVGIFNKELKGEKIPSEMKRYVANFRFTCASGIIGSIIAFPTAIVGLVSAVLRGIKFKKFRIAMNFVFISMMVCLLITNILTVTVASAVHFHFDASESKARGAAWLLIGGQFLLIFHCGLIAFSVLRIIVDWKQ